MTQDQQFDRFSLCHLRHLLQFEGDVYLVSRTFQHPAARSQQIEVAPVDQNGGGKAHFVLIEAYTPLSRPEQVPLQKRITTSGKSILENRIDGLSVRYATLFPT